MKAELAAAITRFAQAQSRYPVTVHLNAADHEASGAVYLTLTGTSAECGDDGAVAR